MKKYEFLYRLQQGLASLPEAERSGHCGFYEELISDMMEDGISEEEAVARLGDPNELAGSILREEGVPTMKSSAVGWREALSQLLHSTVNAVRESVGVREDFEQRLDAYAMRALEIRWISGRVEIRPEDRDDVLLVESRIPEDPPMTAEILDGVLRIDAAPEGVLCRREKTLTVALPAELAETLERCAVITVSGDTAIRGVRAEALSVGTRSGDLQITEAAANTASFSSASGDMHLELDADDTVIRTVSGDVRLRIDRARRIDLATTSGDLEIRGECETLQIKTVSGDLDWTGMADRIGVNTVSGDCDIRLRGCPARFSAVTVSGDLELQLPAGSQCPYEFRSGSGELEADGVRIFSSADPVFSFKTASGDVTIRG